jgi:hypothetical protein
MIVFLSATLVCLALLTVVGLGILRRADLLARFQPADTAEFDRIGRAGTLHVRDERSFFDAELQRAGLKHAQPRALLSWLMNQVTSYAPHPPLDSAEQALRHARDGGGLLCDDMTELYRHALTTAGHRSRRVQLVRSLFHAADTHVTTEVLVNDRWVVYDPTFHASFKNGEELTGAAAIHASVLRGDGAVQPVFHGDVAYPIRFENYYLDWRPLYNNVMILDPGSRHALLRMPPFRYWYGPRYHYLADAAGASRAARGLDRVYQLFVVVLPLLVLVIAAALAIALLVT